MGPLEAIWSKCLPMQGHLVQVVQDQVQTAFEYLQGYREFCISVLLPYVTGRRCEYLQNKYCRYFHQATHMDISPSDSNEQGMLDRENKHVHKSGGRLWGIERAVVVVSNIKPVSFAFRLLVRLTISRKWDGNWNSKNLANLGAFWVLRGILEEEDNFVYSSLLSP